MSNLIASDDRNTEFVGARNPDDTLHVTFYMRSEQDFFKSEKEGHPIFRDEEFVRIIIPGRNDLTLDVPVEPQHRLRFPRQWAVFQNMKTNEEQTPGTPVTEWPVLTRAQAEELKGKKFYTVEQIASCSDAQIQALGMNANTLRTKARAYLLNAKDSAQAQAQAVELERKEKEIAELKEAQARNGEQMEQMNKSMQALIAKLAKQDEPAKGKEKAATAG